MNNRMGFGVAVKQVFETYVYDLGMSSVVPVPFVMAWHNGAHGKACDGRPQERLGERENCAGADSPAIAVCVAYRVAGIAGEPAPTGSGEGVDQGAEHFIGGLGDFGAQLHLKLALGHFDHIAGRVGRLRTVIGLQKIALGVRRLGRGGAGNSAGGLVDAALPGLNRAQTRIKRAAARNFHGVDLLRES